MVLCTGTLPAAATGWPATVADADADADGRAANPSAEPLPDVDAVSVAVLRAQQFPDVDAVNVPVLGAQRFPVAVADANPGAQRFHITLECANPGVADDRRHRRRCRVLRTDSDGRAVVRPLRRENPDVGYDYLLVPG